MPFPKLHRTLIKPAGRSLRRAAALNPLTIHRKGTRAKAIFALALVCLFWGTTWIGSKLAVRHMPPLQVAGLRQTLSGLCYVLFFAFRGAAWPDARQWRSITILAL